MHYLILTPDGVGSTILQRLLTVSLHLQNKKVVNTHELTNGLELTKSLVTKNPSIGYKQSLKEIESLLKKNDEETRLVSRLAKYHIDKRQDNSADQYEFYNFLNNFYHTKIMCVRKNIFEYAMSWSIRKKSGVLNVYNKKDKEKVLQVTDVDEEYFLKKCMDYVNYVKWIEKNFKNVKVISYEDMLIESDKVIAELTNNNKTFESNFGVTCSNIIKKEYELFNFLSNKNLKHNISRKEQKAILLYKKVGNELIKKNIIHSLPIKNTTLTDKQKQIKNFQTCLNKFYKFAKNHNWIDQSNATYDFWNKTHIC